MNPARMRSDQLRGNLYRPVPTRGAGRCGDQCARHRHRRRSVTCADTPSLSASTVSCYNTFSQ